MAKKQKAKQDAKEPKEEVIEEILEEVPEAEIVEEPIEEPVEEPAPATPAEIILEPVAEGEYEIIELRGSQWKKITKSDGTIVMNKLL